MWRQCALRVGFVLVGASMVSSATMEGHISEVKVAKVIDFTILYDKLAESGKSWSFVSSASDDPSTNVMNVAYPNYGTQYYGTAFSHATTFTVSGSFPDA